MMDSELEQKTAQQAGRDRRAGAAAKALLESLGYVYIDHTGRWDPPVDIPVGESQTISPSEIGHASSLFGPLGSGR